MGLSFDGNGRYVGWSNLFDYSSELAIKASESLPMPKKIAYKVSKDGFNIDDFVDQIEKVEQVPELRVQLYADLLNYLYKHKITNLSYTNPYGEKVIAQLGMHEFTNIPVNLKEDASKNFISSHIQNTVQNLRNMIGAYSPIEMEDFRAASSNSPKGEQSSKMTLMNPATKLLMQIQNITGKNVIGIAANGEKGSFMWHYYINDVLHQVNPLFDSDSFQKRLNLEIDKINQSSTVKYEYVDVRKYLIDSVYKESIEESHNDIINKIPLFRDLDSLSDDLDFAKFHFDSTRIYGRAKGDPSPKPINMLPDVNFEGINSEFVSSLDPQLIKGYITVDLMISQVLSAATDNAKELILAKVNAGNKLAKMYLFLITLGFDINDIVKFMTSPAINFIDSITETNVFTGQDIKLKNAIEIARGNYSSLITKNIKEALRDKDKSLIRILERGDLENFKNPFSYDDGSIYNDVEDLMILIGSIKHLQNYNPTDQSIIQDINEFENVMEGANEFSSFSQSLGANQGIPTSKIDLQKKTDALQKLYQTRFSETKTVMEEPLDVNRFFVDKEYAKAIKKNYNKVKKCVNTFAVIDYIAHFKAIFSLFSAVIDMDHNISIKSQIYNYAYGRLYKDNPYISETYQKNLLRSIDNIYINMFINTLNLEIPYIKGSTILEENRSSHKALEGGVLKLDSLSNIATFKLLFENQIIPNLQKGIIYDKVGNKIIEKEDKRLLNNPFIRSLIKGFDKDIPLYKCDLNMLTIENSNDSKIKFQTYLKGLKQLKGIDINGIPLSNLFILYNLIVNKNQYGSDRLTTLFDTFIQNSEQLSMINEYLQYIGDLDYKGIIQGDGDNIKITYDGKETNVLLSDLKRLAAPIVRTAYGQSDPMIIINTQDGPILYEKQEGEYIPLGNLIPTIKGESPTERLERIYNDKAYFVLGGSNKILIDRLLWNLQQINDDTISAIRDLQRMGVLTIQKICE